VAHVEVRFPRRSSLLLGALPSAVRCARRHARQVLWEWGLSENAEIAELLLSELATNAVQAARATVNDMPVNVRLSANRDRLLIEVWDSNVQPPTPRALDVSIVGALSARRLCSAGSRRGCG
jgi:anti-sigma regulatory factor (Ser/Thr protein kinase)